MKRVGHLSAAALVFAIDVLHSLLNFQKGEGLVAKLRKTADLLVRRAAYFAADYGLALSSAALVGGTKALGFSFFWVFVALWIFDFVTAGLFVVFYERTGKDLSLGEDFRRATDTIREKSRMAGRMAVALVIGQSIFWTGPEHVVIFFRKEIGATPRIMLVLLVLTAIQAIIWAVLYGLGYDLVAG